MKTASKQIVAIQVIRAFAAICVVMGHSIEEYGNRFHCSVDAYMKYSWLNGVDLFFVISGFIMIVTIWDNFSKGGTRVLFFYASSDNYWNICPCNLRDDND
jgi:peptidoglycan/LPS O-acetylase OafA/YrhL